jgi:hypothetical protein
MDKIWKTIRGFVWWTHERGSVRYDVMVTVILLFIFLAPYKIGFNDKPAERNPHQSEVVVHPDGQGGFVYEISPSAVRAGDGDAAAIRTDLLRVIEPIAGEVELQRYETVVDRRGRITLYRAWVRR